MKKIIVVGLLVIAFSWFLGSSAFAQGGAMPFVVQPANDGTACWALTYTNPKGDYKKFLQDKCKKERDAVTKVAALPSPEIGLASANKAVTTVTYRQNADGSFDGSKEGAKLVLDLRKEDRKENVGVANAENPTCHFWSGCPVVVGGGYYGGVVATSVPFDCHALGDYPLCGPGGQVISGRVGDRPIGAGSYTQGYRQPGVSNFGITVGGYNPGTNSGTQVLGGTYGTYQPPKKP